MLETNTIGDNWRQKNGSVLVRTSNQFETKEIYNEKPEMPGTTHHFKR